MARGQHRSCHLGQFKVMTALEACRTAAIGGHVAACEDSGHGYIAYNSYRNRHRAKCQGTAAEDWLTARKAELLPAPYYHVVITLPSLIASAYQNKTVIYDHLFKAAAETLLTIATDPKHLGARIGIISVLHTWGSAMMHHLSPRQWFAQQTARGPTRPATEPIPRGSTPHERSPNRSHPTKAWQ